MLDCKSIPSSIYRGSCGLMFSSCHPGSYCSKGRQARGTQYGLAPCWPGEPPFMLAIMTFLWVGIQQSAQEIIAMCWGVEA